MPFRTLIDHFDDGEESTIKDTKKKAADEQAAKDADAKKKADEEAAANRKKEIRAEIDGWADENLEPPAKEEKKAPPVKEKPNDAPKGFALVWMLAVLAVIALVAIFAEGCVPVVVVIGDGADDVTCKQSNTSTEPLGEIFRLDWWFPKSKTPAASSPAVPAHAWLPPNTGHYDADGFVHFVNQGAELMAIQCPNAARAHFDLATGHAWCEVPL